LPTARSRYTSSWGGDYPPDERSAWWRLNPNLPRNRTRRRRPKKPWWKKLLTWLIGLVGALILAVCSLQTENPSAYYSDLWYRYMAGRSVWVHIRRVHRAGAPRRPGFAAMLNVGNTTTQYHQFSTLKAPLNSVRPGHVCRINAGVRRVVITIKEGLVSNSPLRPTE
jgi:hypothetical protein